jgi:hypothetical protein
VLNLSLGLSLNLSLAEAKHDPSKQININLQQQQTRPRHHVTSPQRLTSPHLVPLLHLFSGSPAHCCARARLLTWYSIL